MAKFDDKINSLLNEFTTGISGMMNMSSDNLAPAKGWRYAHDEDEEGRKPDYLDFDNDGDKKEPMKQALKQKKGKKKGEEDEEHHEVEARKRLKKDKGMGKSTKKQAEKEIKKRRVSAAMKKRMKDDEEGLKKK